METRRLVQQSQGDEAVARRRVEVLEREVARLSMMLTAREQTIQDLGNDLEKEKSRTRQAEDCLRMTTREVAAAQQEASESQARAERLEEALTNLPRGPPVGHGLGVCERLLDANGTVTQWCGALATESVFVGVLCYTFDLDCVLRALIGVVARRGRVCVIADESKTHESRAAGQAFAQAQARGIEVRCGRGIPLVQAYLHANPQGKLQNRHGHSHAKVLFASGSGYLFIGSTNYTTSSTANVEATAQIKLSPEGHDEVAGWFDNLWTQALPHVLSSGVSRSPSRSRAQSQGPPRAARPGNRGGNPHPWGPNPPFGHHASQEPAPWETRA